MRLDPICAHSNRSSINVFKCNKEQVQHNFITEHFHFDGCNYQKNNRSPAGIFPVMCPLLHLCVCLPLYPLDNNLINPPPPA